MNTTIAPVPNKDREVFMDVLRGFAILGILIANLTMGGLSLYNSGNTKTGVFLLPHIDHQLSFLYSMFIDGKFYSIFSLLFGWGIALQLQRGFVNDINPLPTVKRRLLFMLLLGSIHILIWTGDIVLFYAMLGFVLLLFRKFSNKTLLITGAVLILLPIVLYAAKMNWPWVNAPANVLNSIAVKLDEQLLGISNETVTSYFDWAKQANWRDIFLGNISGTFYRFQYLFFISRIPKVLGMFLIGFVIGRSNFYKNFTQNKKIIYWVIGLGLLFGLPANYYLAYYMRHFEADYFTLKINGLYQTIAYALGVAPLALAYVGIFMLIFKTDIGNKIMSIIAPVGKMAFSNYMMHSLVCSFVFLGAGLGYGGEVGTLYLTVFALLLFTFQIVSSTIWLKYFNYGPVEWIWRSLTYGKMQPIKKYT